VAIDGRAESLRGPSVGTGTTPLHQLASTDCEFCGQVVLRRRQRHRRSRHGHTAFGEGDGKVTEH